MPIEDYIPNVFGQAPVGYEGLLGAERTQGLQKTANLQGLLGAAGALAQGLSSQGPRRSALQNILGAIGGGFQGSQGAYQQGLQQFGQQQQLGQGIQKNDAINKVLADPKIANDPAMRAWVLANTDKALEMLVQRQGIADFMAKENAPQISQTQMPQDAVVAPNIASTNGDIPLAPVTVTGTQSPFEKDIKQNELLAKYWASVGNDPIKAKEYQSIAENLRKQRSQFELAANVPDSLSNVNPLFQPLVDTLAQNAASMTPSEIQSAVMDIRKKNSDFKVTTETELRKEFSVLPEIKEFSTVETAFRQINSALSNPSAANDLAAATKFMKLLDPGSVVRESELGMAMAATGAIDRMQNYFQRLQNGQVLNPDQRADFKKSAAFAFNAAKETRDQTASRYVNLANTYNVDPNNVVLKSKSANSKPSAPSKPIPPRNNKGWVLSTDANGNRAYVSPDGTNFEEVK